jgi:excisionase family DNA binding protein
LSLIKVSGSFKKNKAIGGRVAFYRARASAFLSPIFPKTAYKLAVEGKLPGFKVGGSWRFKAVDIESWIEDKKVSDKSSSL